MTHVLIAIAVMTITASSAAQDSLESVREQYASADYEGALGTLNRLEEKSENAAIGTEIAKFRMLCLFALGRKSDAEQAIKDILADDPLYTLSAADAPPRIRAAFGEVRRHVLPGLVRTLYKEGKAAYDRQAFPEAMQKLERTLQLLDDPDAAVPDVADLRALTSGFLDLSRIASVDSRPTSAVVPASRAAEETPLVEPTPNAALVNSEPVALHQPIPPWMTPYQNASFNAEFQGSVEVDIDERGTVVGVQISKPIHPSYDPLLLQAARTWRYEPARRNGQPVKALKRVNIVLRTR